MDPRRVFAEYPLIVFVICFVTQWLAAHAGARLRGKAPIEEHLRKDVELILYAALTLLGLIVGFSFSMAISRYDQRKANEGAEASAIGTAYVKSSLLPPADAAKVRELLRAYLNERVLFYSAENTREADRISESTWRLETDLWSAVQGPAQAQPTPITALVVSSVTDVTNARTNSEASVWNRIPFAAWALLGIIALSSNMLFGYDVRITIGEGKRFLILPLLVSTSLYLIADMDNPHGGTINVKPRNLVSLSRSLSVP